jgi:hypothetical protein
MMCVFFLCGISTCNCFKEEQFRNLLLRHREPSKPAILILDLVAVPIRTRMTVSGLSFLRKLEFSRRIKCIVQRSVTAIFKEISINLAANFTRTSKFFFNNNTNKNKV